jgi:glycosyltransferase involved in cell wall biosynthesis
MQTNMRVLHLLKTSVGATWALRLVHQLVNLGVEVHVALPSGGLTSDYEAAGARTHELQPELPMRRPWNAPSRLRALRRLVDETKPDLLHSHFVSTTLAMRLALGHHSPIRRIFQVPGPLHLEHPITRTLELKSAGSRDYWIGSCEWTCEKYRALGVPTSRVFLAYYGVDPTTFRRPEIGSLRRQLNVPREVPIVGMVAYMYAPKRYLGQTRGLKGHEDLIDAMVEVRRRRPDALLVVVGGAWGGAERYAAHIRDYAARRLGAAAVFLGTRSNVPSLYADFDVAVHPSLSENVGGAMESLLLRVPTIATAVGGFPDAVIDGVTGWLVPPRSPSRLASAILNVLSDPQRTRAVAATGERRAQELFGVERNSALVLSAYNAILRD